MSTTSTTSGQTSTMSDQSSFARTQELMFSLM